MLQVCPARFRNPTWEFEYYVLATFTFDVTVSSGSCHGGEFTISQVNVFKDERLRLRF